MKNTYKTLRSTLRASLEQSPYKLKAPVYLLTTAIVSFFLIPVIFGGAMSFILIIVFSFYFAADIGGFCLLAMLNLKEFTFLQCADMEITK